MLILAVYGSQEDVRRAFEAGAGGFVLKDDPPQMIVTALRLVALGGAAFGPQAANKLFGASGRPIALPGKTQADLMALAPREREVLVQVGYGLSNAEIGSVLAIAEDTVKTHIASLVGTLGVNRVQAAVLAAQAGLLAPLDERPGAG